MQNRDYVGMNRCFYCGEAKGIVVDRRLRKTLPSSAVYDFEPCRQCAEFMRQGVIFISVRDGETDSRDPYRTGRFCVIREDGVKLAPIDDEAKAQALKNRVCWVEDRVWDALGLPSKDHPPKGPQGAGDN